MTKLTNALSRNEVLVTMLSKVPWIVPLLLQIVAPITAGALEQAPRYRYGFMDTAGTVVINPKFDWASDFSQGLAVIGMNQKNGLRYGYIDTSGKVVIRPQYDNAQSFSENLAAVDIGQSRGFIDKTGKLVISAEFDAKIFDSKPAEACPYFPMESKFVKGLAPVRIARSHQCGFINQTGNLIIPAKFSNARPFSEGLAAVEVSGKWGFINKDGQFVINPQFTDAGDFSEGLAPAAVPGHFEIFKPNTDKLWGYIDKNGLFVVKPVFAYGYPFSNGLAAVGINSYASEFGYIDRHGVMALPKKVLRGKPFSEEIAGVYLPCEEHWSFVDKAGHVAKTSADILASPSEGLACFGVK